MRKVGQDRFGLHAVMMMGVAAAGIGLTMWIPKSAEERLSAFLGVGLASLSGALALGLKRRALGQDLNATLKTVAVLFGIRAVMVVTGLLWVVWRRLGEVPFVLGFFGVYFALQWIEISYVVSATQADDGDG